MYHLFRDHCNVFSDNIKVFFIIKKNIFFQDIHTYN